MDWTKQGVWAKPQAPSSGDTGEGKAKGNPTRRKGGTPS